MHKYELDSGQFLLFRTSAAFTTIAATLHIIIADAAFGLPDTGLEFSDAVTDTEGEGLVDVLRPTVCMEEGILRRIIILLVFLQEVRGRERHVKAVFQPRLLNAHAVTAITAAAALQVDVWRYTIEVKGQSPVLGKRLLCTAIGKKAPSVIGKGAAIVHVGIGESSVDIDTGVLGGIPVDVCIQVDALTAPDVLVGGVEYILSRRILQTWDLRVGHHPHHVLDAVVGETIAQGKVDIELRRKIAVTEVERMTLLTLKMGITLIDI